MTAGISISGVSFTYGRKRALRDVSFDVAPGQFCALLGPNGAGKSTLMALLTRLISTKTGQISLAGFDLAQSPRRAMAGMGVVFQSQTLDLDLTARRNLLYFAALRGLSRAEAAKRTDQVLDQLAMRERQHEKTRALNGGHRRRLEIARALIGRPKVLLLDEPTVGLDVASRQAIVSHVHDLADDGMAVLWTTHLTDEIHARDKVVILHQGEVLRDGTVPEVAGHRPLKDVFLDLTQTGVRP